MTHIKTELSPQGSPSEGHRDNPAQQCRDRGGRWDAKNQRCIMPADTIKGKPVGFVETPRGATVVVPARELSTEELARQAEERRLEDIRVEQEPIEAERVRLLQEELPVRRELDPTRQAIETVPVIGPLAKKLFDLIPGFKERSTEIPLTPETLRTTALTEIEKQEIERGLTANENFGSFVEAIPLIGSLATKFAGGLIETPSGNAAEVVTNIRKEKRRLSNIETNVKLNYLPVAAAQTQITDIENNIQRLESRLKLLISESPELKFNSDNINTIETEILLAREKVFQAKLNVLEGAITSPTELQIFLKLQETPEEVEEFEF